MLWMIYSVVIIHVLVLTGEQGKFKTTFLDLLCPEELKSYLFTGKIDPQGKDIQTLIAEYLFINIDDQLKALNKRDENELKNLITTPRVKYRRPYDTYIEEYPHLASFIASVNGNDFLTDPTGSRRFLPLRLSTLTLTLLKRLISTRCTPKQLNCGELIIITGSMKRK